MNYDKLKVKIEKAVPGAKLKIVRESLLVENAQDLPKVVSFLKSSEEFRLDFLSSVTGVDYLTFLEVVYHLYSVEKKSGQVVLRARTSREETSLPSLVPVFRGAEYQEREVYDMYGIHFENHPDLRRLFMWEGFEGFPLRKDYVQEDSETLEMADIEWLEKNQIPVSPEAKQKAEDLHAQGKRATSGNEGKES